MNGKQYVGKNASTFESYKPNSPVTGVRLLVDDETEYVAGDTEGNVWELTCPYGTQEMADNILTSLSGKIYKGFEADDAALSPAAELGDGVTVNGLYTMLAYRKVAFGPGHMSTIAAPGDNEPDEEYKYTPLKDREVNRKLAQTRSLITKTAEQIRLEVTETVNGLSASFTTELGAITGRVDGLNGQFTEFKNTVDGFTVTDPSGTTRIKGSSIETGSIAAGSIRADQIQLSGAITWGDLDSGVQNTIYAQHTSLPRYIKNTYIDSTEIRSPTIMANVFEVHPSDASDPDGSFDIYGNHDGREYHMFSIQYIAGDSPTVELISPADSDIYIGNQSSNYSTVYPRGRWNFSNATVSGLKFS